MFNLEPAITHWRKQMLAAGIKSPVPLEEIESHLREEIEQMVTTGFSEAEAFQTAIHKIGSATALRTEFKKVEAPRKVGKLLRLEIWSAIFSILFALLVGGDVLFQRGDQTTDSQRMYCLTGLVLFVLCVLIGRFWGQIFPGHSSKRTRTMINFLHFVLLGVLTVIVFRYLLPLHKPTAGQFTMVIIWGCLIPTGANIGIYWGSIATARKNLTPAHS